MEAAVPREIINPCGRFEKYDRRARWRWRVTDDEFSYACNFEIIEPADKSALDALGEKFSKHGHRDLVFGNRYSYFGDSEGSISYEAISS